MEKQSWDKIYDIFKKKHPELRRRGMTFNPHSYGTIEIRIPMVGHLLYDGDTDKINWVEQYDVKHNQITHRQFCKAVESYMNVHGLTQQEFADIIGLSRQMLSRYLNGISTPRVNTMIRICKIIDADNVERR